MVNVLVNGQGKVYMLNGQALCEASAAMVTLTIQQYMPGGEYSGLPDSVIINGNSVSIPSTVQVQSGQSCTIVATYSSSTYSISIGIDGVEVIDESTPCSYTFTPTTNHTIGVARCIAKG